jgi:alkanesulfonate monooxygenase SsuD/methylene tetrahydromethanopterin reductase-like flavin-dependent oxidoreductase (luciferase family)
MIARGGANVVEAEMPDEWIDWFAAAGEPDQCLERLRSLRDAGSTSVVLALTDPATVRSSLGLLATEVLPKFASSRR